MTAVFSLILLGERLSLAGIAGAAIIIICSVMELVDVDKEGKDVDSLSTTHHLG
jgi:hypothetical protein